MGFFFRLCGVNLLAEEGPGWWPDVDLIEHYGLKDYEDSKWETMLLGHKPDGREGLLIPSIPPYVQKNGADGKGNANWNSIEITLKYLKVRFCGQLLPSCLKRQGPRSQPSNLTLKYFE